MAACQVLLMTHGANGMPEDPRGERPKPWDFALSGSYYAFPSDPDLPLVVARAVHGGLHLEGRYNYEARRTGSVFAGWNMSGGESFTAEVTPMVGAAFGATTGVIPALELSLGYGIVDLYAEGEYLFDLHDSSGNFAYTWLELGATPSDLFRAGLVAQRMREYRSPLDLDRGLFAQVMPGNVTVSLYAFNLFTHSWFFVVGCALEW